MISILWQNLRWQKYLFGTDYFFANCYGIHIAILIPSGDVYLLGLTKAKMEFDCQNLFPSQMSKSFHICK